MFNASSIDLVLRVLREGLLLAVLVSAPLLLATFVVGLVSGAFSALTQIHDHAVGFVPRLVVLLLGLVLMGPYLGAQMVRFATSVFSLMAGVR
ncbi:MAG: flagellar biosynthetic protein FliQ [Deltaproteobacteria bacterium]|nr:flagellar biosynthetic protein FliQ [Deltaproteobacteria bacterium]